MYFETSLFCWTYLAITPHTLHRQLVSNKRGASAAQTLSEALFSNPEGLHLQDPCPSDPMAAVQFLSTSLVLLV